MRILHHCPDLRFLCIHNYNFTSVRPPFAASLELDNSSPVHLWKLQTLMIMDTYPRADFLCRRIVVLSTCKISVGYTSTEEDLFGLSNISLLTPTQLVFQSVLPTCTGIFIRMAACNLTLSASPDLLPKTSDSAQLNHAISVFNLELLPEMPNPTLDDWNTLLTPFSSHDLGPSPVTYLYLSYWQLDDVSLDMRHAFMQHFPRLSHLVVASTLTSGTVGAFARVAEVLMDSKHEKLGSGPPPASRLETIGWEGIVLDQAAGRI